MEPKGDGALGLARGPYSSFYPGTLPEKQGPASQLRNSATPPPGVAELRSWPSLKSPERESIHEKKQTPSGVEAIVGMRRQPIFLPVGFGFPTTIQPILG